MWRSEDGRTWELLTPQAAWEGRGGHQVAPYLLGGQVYLAGRPFTYILAHWLVRVRAFGVVGLAEEDDAHCPRSPLPLPTC